MKILSLLIVALVLAGCSTTHTGFVSTPDGGRIYYEEGGKGEPMLLLHGHSLDRRMWDDQWKPFSKHFRVVRLDFRGYGRSSVQREDLQFCHVDDVVTLMDSLGISQAHVVGLSMGSFVAGDMLAMYPERLSSCTMASGGIRNSKGPSEPMDSMERAKRDREIAALKVKGIDNFITYGGTMSRLFANKNSADDYIDSSIAQNIQLSLKCFQHEGHFRSLQQLYDAGELTNAIIHFMKEVSYRFINDILMKIRNSKHLEVSFSTRQQGRIIRDTINFSSVIRSLSRQLYYDRREQAINISDAQRNEIKEYLDLLNITCDIDVVNMSNLNERKVRTVLLQPGLCYTQAATLIQSILRSEANKDFHSVATKTAKNQIFYEIHKRMMEEIVLLETKFARPEMQVFQLKFAVGGFDMVVFDPIHACCEIYEIKRSNNIDAEQYRHLLSPNKCAETESRYGRILSKNVIYCGPSTSQQGVNYLNVEEYLKAPFKG